MTPRTNAPGPARERALRVAQSVFGDGQLRSMLMVITLLVTLGWFTDSLFEWLTDLGNAIEGHPVDDWFPLHRLFASLAFATVLGYLYHLAHEARERYRPGVSAQTAPGAVRGLILYLSSSPNPADIREALPRLTDMPALRAQFERINWRMPLEAIAHHQDRLEHIVIIGSSGENGSASQIPLFRELTRQILSQCNPDIIDACELDADFCAGVDFENVEELARATDLAYDHLIDTCGLPIREILIDITGGPKTAAVAGTIVALSEGRRVEYVTNAYRVCVFDATYDI